MSKVWSIVFVLVLVLVLVLNAMVLVFDNC